MIAAEVLQCNGYNLIIKNILLKLQKGVLNEEQKSPQPVCSKFTVGFEESKGKPFKI